MPAQRIDDDDTRLPLERGAAFRAVGSSVVHGEVAVDRGDPRERDAVGEESPAVSFDFQ